MYEEKTIKKFIIITLILLFVTILFLIFFLIKNQNSYFLKNECYKENKNYIINNYYLNENVVYNDNQNVVYNDKLNLNNRIERSLKYFYFSRLVKRQGIFDNEIYEFQVYVKNLDKYNGYFEVIYYFEDCQGREYSESVSKYIESKSLEKFNYISVGFEKNICKWSYKIIPEKIII